MAITINGTAGIDFDIKETDTALTTGNIVQTHTVETDISKVNLTNTDLVASLSGTIGTTLVSFDLTDLVSKSGGAGPGIFDISVIRNHNIPFGKIKSIVIHNTSLFISNLGIIPIANSFFSLSGNFSIEKSSAISRVYSPERDSSSDKLINLLGSSANITLEMFILGTP